MKSPKSKGMKFERKLAKLFSAIPGWSGRRQPGSGIYDHFPHDLQITDPLDRPWIVEAKKWKHGWRTGDKAKGQAAMLVIERDFGEPCIYMSLADFAVLVAPLADVKENAE
jgi:hypothetical protein